MERDSGIHPERWSHCFFRVDSEHRHPRGLSEVAEQGTFERSGWPESGIIPGKTQYHMRSG